jgi:LmbE family N-acetylglucosaminyl deacetylase
MKKNLFFTILLLPLMIIGGHIAYLFYLSSDSEYSEDDFLLKANNKNAVVIVAHDDDAISMSGTIAMLTNAGWNVSELCFYQGWKDKDDIRKRDLTRAAEILKMAPPSYHNIALRTDRSELTKPWMPITNDQFDSVYIRKEAYPLIANFIEKHQPSVIFTLDNIMGGYGHPDHVFISQLVMDYCADRLSDSSFSVQRIYQAVFPTEMNERILGDMEVYQAAKQVYTITYFPEPDFFISITGYEQIKKDALLAFTTEQHALKKIWPYYDSYPATIYFNIFNKEYYRVLDMSGGF